MPFMAPQCCQHEAINPAINQIYYAEKTSSAVAVCEPDFNALAVSNVSELFSPCKGAILSRASRSL